ncbi:MAG: hypothetical protein KGN02_11115 [bacterium]|nr:hypothetical protein [bacterium]
MTARLTTLLVLLGAFAVALFASTGVAQAHPRSVYHGGTYFGSVVVEPGQVVDGDLNVFFGNAEILGSVNGDVNVFGGNIDVRGGEVAGQTHAIAGAVTQSIVPWAPSTTVETAYGSDSRLWWRVAWAAVALVVFLIFPVRTRMALDRLEQHPGLSTAAGLVGWVAVFPLAILLVVTVLLIPLVPLEFVLLMVAVFIGHAALALLIGRRFYELLQPTATPTPLVALILGLALLTAAELVPVVGVLVMLLVGLVGVGAVILTFIPEQTVGGTGFPPPPQQGVSGPPMPIG